MEEDRISSLPDCLLIEIISRLPSTKQAIETSTLSKRWIHLWMEVSSLVFLDDKLDGDCNYSIPDSLSVVEKTLTQHRQQSLNKFQIHIPYYSSSWLRSKVIDWIRYAIKCNVQELDIALRIRTYYKYERMLYERKLVFDHSFFVNSCFSHLKWKGCLMLLNPSGTISWTNLRSLCISYCKLDEGFIQNVLSGYPLLETLKLEFCYGFSRIDVTSKSFKNLAIVGYLDFGDGESRPIIKSDAPYILSLKLQRYVSCNRIVIDGCLDIKDSESRPIIGLGYGIEDYTIHREEEIVNKLIQNLSHAKEVTIKTSCLLTLFGLKANGVSFTLW